MAYDFVVDTAKLDEVKNNITTVSNATVSDVGQLYSIVESIQSNGALIGDVYETFTEMNTAKYRNELEAISPLLNAYSDVLDIVTENATTLNNEIIEACNIE